MMLANHHLKEDIRAYWSKRSETFDNSTGHRIEDSAEAPEWRKLFRAGLGDITGKRVLDLACGTGEISRMLLAMGAEVTALDFAEPMLARAKRKNAGERFSAHLADVEDLGMEADATYDAVVNRHLVWTLLDPHRAFGEWRRVLKPGGRLLIVDGNWVTLSPLGKAMRALGNRISKKNSMHGDEIDMTEHNRILSGVHYARGLTPEQLQIDLAAHGFGDFRLQPVHRIYLWGMRKAPLADRIRLLAPRRFALSATAI